MDLDSVKRLLEGGEEESDNASIDAVSNNTEIFDPLIVQGIQVDVIEPGRLVCSMKVPLRLLNSGNFLHGGAMASLVDIIGGAAILTVGAQASGVSIEINVSYLDAAFVDVQVQLCKVLSIGLYQRVLMFDAYRYLRDHPYFAEEEIEIEAKVLRAGKAIGVFSVELRKKKTGEIIAQGRHTKYLAEEIEIEANVLRVGKAIGVVSVELMKKETGKIITQGRYTKYLAVSSKL